MSEWDNDGKLFSLIKSELYTPVVGDILDKYGKYHQFLPPQIQPMKDNQIIVGRAMPVLMIDVFGPQKKPFGLLTEALDQLEKEEIYIASGGTMRCAYWGEILTVTAKKRRAAGAVIDGFHRDTPMILKQSWPVFSRGRYAQDSSVRTKVADYRCPIEIGKVWINPGDLVFADLDGVLIIPREIEEKIIQESLDKSRTEKLVLEEIKKGMTSTEAFKRYGVL
jgi:4-hydroxy-4-methyl-2-oxoglutarate aldolase